VNGEWASPLDTWARKEAQLFGKTVMTRWREMGVCWPENGLVKRERARLAARTRLYCSVVTVAW